MKKTNLIIVAVVIILLLLGAWLFIFNKKAPQTGQQSGNPSGSQSQGESARPGVKESLLGLLEGATGIKCSIEDANGKYTVTAKGEKARIDGMSFPNSQNLTVSEPGSMINDGTWAYAWNGKDGMKFNLKDMQENSSASVSPDEKSTDWKAWVKDMETSGAKYDCNPTVATDADFTPPSDVKFQDFGEIFKNLKQIQSNPNIPIDPNQFKIPQ
jgi:hypothetical protein